MPFLLHLRPRVRAPELAIRSRSLPRPQPRLSARGRAPNRPFSSQPPPSPSSSTATSSTTSTPSTRAARLLARLPPSLQKHASHLRSAPVSHVVAFLILHELTAVVPLLGLFGLLHYGGSYVGEPIGWVTERYGGYVQQGAARFERYFRRKGWFGFGEEGEDGADVTGAEVGEEEEGRVWQWEKVDGKYKVVLEIAVAWAVTKALLPVRIVASLWATPWFAGVLLRFKRFARLGR